MLASNYPQKLFSSENTSTLLDKYKWILFDADETLFTFDSYLGLRQMFAKFGVEFTEKDFREYLLKNKSLWVDYQNGVITAKDVQCGRFALWSEKVGETPEFLNSAFLKEMLEISSPIPGVVNLLNSLKGKVKLGIITNGFVELQQARLNRNNLNNHFEVLVVSESVGVAKPHPKIFEHTLSLIGNPDKSHVLMVGDSLETDILGALNVGLDTCHINNKNIANANIKPHYEVTNIPQLEELLTKTNTLKADQVDEISKEDNLSLGKL